MSGPVSADFSNALVIGQKKSDEHPNGISNIATFMTIGPMAVCVWAPVASTMQAKHQTIHWRLISQLSSPGVQQSFKGDGSVPGVVPFI